MITSVREAFVYFIASGASVLALGLVAATLVFPRASEPEVRARDFESTGHVYVESETSRP
ncbi:MAG: hypothetical protein H6737_24975 [Alphaproteobacteria bacterium]|nr:hypothetical protein [Alphaproteobacteria bacterium]